jgi:hypothetical protein
MGNTCAKPKSVTTTWDDAQLIGSNPVSVTTIHIQNLKPILNKVKDPLESDNEHWLKLVNGRERSATAQGRIRYFQSNIPATSYSTMNQFFRAFHMAYYNHGEVMLSPDDIWICILLNFSKYINDNAEELRHFFVEHEEKKELTIELLDENWPLFLKEITTMIGTNTKEDVVDLLTCNFSTTGVVERQISQVATMDSFQKYFDYGMEIGCGIGKVHFMGESQDWDVLLKKIRTLKHYHTIKTERKWTFYVEGLEVIVKKFISTRQGNNEKSWWNEIVDEKFNKMYGMAPEKLSGWITKFWYPVNDSFRSVIDIPVLNFAVPVKITSTHQPTQMVTVNAGFSGVAVKRNIYRPQLSLCVTTNPEPKPPKKKVSFLLNELEKRIPKRVKPFSKFRKA